MTTLLNKREVIFRTGTGGVYSRRVALGTRMELTVNHTPRGGSVAKTLVQDSHHTLFIIKNLQTKLADVPELL